MANRSPAVPRGARFRAHRAINLIPGLSVAARRVAAVLLEHTGDAGNAWPSDARLSAILQISRRSVVRARGELVAVGLFEVVGRNAPGGSLVLQPFWERFDAICIAFAEAMKTGSARREGGDTRVTSDKVGACDKAGVRDVTDVSHPLFIQDSESAEVNPSPLLGSPHGDNSQPLDAKASPHGSGMERLPALRVVSGDDEKREPTDQPERQSAFLLSLDGGQSAEPATAVAVLAAIVGDELAAAINEHRRRLKKPLTIRAAKALAGKLAGATDPVLGAQAMLVHGWIGFEPAWLDRVSGGQRSQSMADTADKLTAWLRSKGR